MASIEVIISWVITSVIGLLAVLFMRKIPRSKGRPPAFITDKFGKAGTVVGSLVFLALYIAGAVVILLVMPEKVQHKLFSPAGVVIVGTVFPIVESIITVCTISAEDDKTWLQYWIAQASFSYATEFVDIIAENAPFVREHWYEFEFFFMVSVRYRYAWTIRKDEFEEDRSHVFPSRFLVGLALCSIYGRCHVAL